MTNKQKPGVVRIGDLVCPQRKIVTFSWDDPEIDRDWVVAAGQVGLVVGLDKSDAIVLFHARTVDYDDVEVGDLTSVKLWVLRTDLKVLKRC